MRDRPKHYFVNWIDGMKINKQHFVDQNHAIKDALIDAAGLSINPYRYGILPPSIAGENTYSVKVSLDNQNTLRIVVDACQAVTPGGVRIALPAFAAMTAAADAYRPEAMLPFAPTNGDMEWYIMLIIHPFDTQTAGTLDISETPPRHHYVLPTYTLEVVSANQYRQFAHYPYALTIGKLFVSANEVSIEDYYIPPCYAVNAHPELVSLLGEMDSFLASLERHCTKIVQNILHKEQQGKIVELVHFLCDRVILYLGQAITAARWTLLHDSPAALFFTIAALARGIKNTIDLRIGSGKDELMSYLSNWCDLSQGELESMLTSIANMAYDHNDVNKNISEAAVFVKVMNKLFGTLSKLDLIDKRKEKERVEIFVNEERSGDLTRNTIKPKHFG